MLVLSGCATQHVDSAHFISLAHNKLLVFGDYTNLRSTYDFDAEQWQKLNVNYKASRHHATTTLGNITYVIGGILVIVVHISIIFSNLSCKLKLKY
jgi:hypothetical protein